MRQQNPIVALEHTKPLASASAAQQALSPKRVMPSAHLAQMDTVLLHLHHLALLVYQDITPPRDHHVFNAPLEASPRIKAVQHARHALMDRSLLLAHHLAAPVRPDSLSCRSVCRVIHRVV